MKKAYLLLIAILSLGLAANAYAIPTLPADSNIVFEFNSWEWVIPEIDSTVPGALEVGDVFSGVLLCDVLTDGVSATNLLDPTTEEISGYFKGLEIADIQTNITTDLLGNTITNYSVFYTFTADATIEVYYDDNTDLSDVLNAADDTYLTADAARQAAIDAVTDGDKLLKMDWGVYTSTTNDQGTADVGDDFTPTFGYANLADDPLNEWAWNSLFVSGIYTTLAGSFDFLYSNEIYAPGSPDFDNSAAQTVINPTIISTPDGDVLDYEVWDFYNTDDFSGRTVVPEPTTMLLLGFGLLSIAGIGRRKKD